MDKYTEALEQVIKTPAGKMVIVGIMIDAGWGQSTFKGNSRSFYLSGVQDLCSSVLRRIREIDIEEYLNIIRLFEEQKDEAQE